jgi:hypothetical protein
MSMGKLSVGKGLSSSRFSMALLLPVKDVEGDESKLGIVSLRLPVVFNGHSEPPRECCEEMLLFRRSSRK